MVIAAFDSAIRATMSEPISVPIMRGLRSDGLEVPEVRLRRCAADWIEVVRERAATNPDLDSAADLRGVAKREEGRGRDRRRRTRPQSRTLGASWRLACRVPGGVSRAGSRLGRSSCLPRQAHGGERSSSLTPGRPPLIGS